jgi:membrane-associated phospholipid phosphatase
MGSGDASPDACRRRRVYWTLGWVVAIALAAVIDPWVSGMARGMTDSVGRLKDTPLATVLKVPGEFSFTLAVAVLAILLHPWKWRAAGLLCLSVIVGGLFYSVLKWLVGRRRPAMDAPYGISPFIGGWKGLFVSQSNLTFPSGHATCAFATAAALAVLFPRWRWVFYAAAALTALERVAERAHYLSDVVAAAGIGILSVQLSIYLGNKLVNREPPLETSCERGQAEPAAQPVRPQ